MWEYRMSEESGFYLKMACNFILGNFDFEDPNNLFPMKNDTRKLMRSCRQCWVSYDINASFGGCCFHRSFFRVSVEWVAPQGDQREVKSVQPLNTKGRGR